MEIWRVKLVLIGGLLASGGIVVLTKQIKHQLNGIAASGNVLELKSECFISRYQAAQNKWSDETIDCATEPELKRTLASDKNIGVMRYDSAMIEFPLQDGSLFKTKVSQQPYNRFGGTPLHTGDRLPVIYDPKAPSLTRAPLGFLDVCVSLSIFVFGAVCVLFGLKFNVRRDSDTYLKPDTAPTRPLPIKMSTTNAPPARQSRVALATGGSPRTVVRSRSP
jgi:hypothetical protein